MVFYNARKSVLGRIEVLLSKIYSVFLLLSGCIVVHFCINREKTGRGTRNSSVISTSVNNFIQTSSTAKRGYANSLIKGLSWEMKVYKIRHDSTNANGFVKTQD